MSTLPRFLCDGMLGQLCRYLRAAGYDTVFDNNGDPDRDLLCASAGSKAATSSRRISSSANTRPRAAWHSSCRKLN